MSNTSGLTLKSGWIQGTHATHGRKSILREPSIIVETNGATTRLREWMNYEGEADQKQ